MEFNTIYLIAAAATLAVLVGLFGYRIGMASAHGILEAELRTARTATNQLHKDLRSARSLADFHEAEALSRLTHLQAAQVKQQHHESQLEAIMLDADNRIAALTRRTLTQLDGDTLHRIAQVLDLARKTFSAMGAVDKANLAQTLSRSALNLAAKAPYNLVKAEERSA